MDLIANKSVEGYTSKLYNISDITFKRDDAALMDRKFVESLSKSLKEKGMEYPILLSKSKNTYVCKIGNNRVHWALENGYTRIDGILVSDEKECKDLLKMTEMKYGQDY